ncbi:Uncharacterised protein [uncultured archaeon]|nr:Uncharacterised protein [uncultured archaeon]
MFLKSESAEVEIVGHIIILGLTITGIAMIMLVGVPTINSMEEMAKVRNAEQMYTVFDSRASKVALGESPMQIINLDAGGGSISVVSNSSLEAGHPLSEESYVLFELKNGTGTVTSITIPMGKVIYRMGDREVAYEGGGVWSKYPEGSVMLSPPEFNYNGITMTFPVVNISGNSSLGGKGSSSLKIERVGEPRMIYPGATYKNPIPENVTEVSITIKSEYYDAWADYFESISLVKVNQDPGEKKVTITLTTPPLTTNFSYGALASDEIEMEENAETDSYDSSKGPYSISKSGNGSIRATKKIEIKNGAVVNGSAMTGADITGGGKIMKDAYAKSFGSVTVLGIKYPKVEGLSLGSTTYLVQSKINQYNASNNNSNSDCLNGARNTILDGKHPNGTSWDTCTMYTGNYYLTKFDMENYDELIFNTGDGAINIAVEADIELHNNVNLIVNGNYPVRLYLNSEIEIGNDVKINPDTNQTSVLFQIISSDSQDIDIENNAEYTGFIWAPAAEIDLSNNAKVYGAIVGKKFDLENNQEMHYDEALKNTNTNVATGTAIMYLYISQNDVVATVS